MSSCLPYRDPRDGILYCLITGDDDYDCGNCDGRADYDAAEADA